jgi:GNAT superfamily N-acetyltransferase
LETARPVTVTDLEEAARFWRDAVGDLAGLRGGQALADTLERPQLHDYLNRSLESSDHLVVLGLIDDVPVGVASVRAGHRVDRPIGELELIYVEPKARRVGVAVAMLDVVAERCRRWGMTGIDVPALPGDRGAKSFFEARGYTARLLVMHRSTPTGDR